MRSRLGGICLGGICRGVKNGCAPVGSGNGPYGAVKTAPNLPLRPQSLDVCGCVGSDAYLYFVPNILSPASPKPGRI